METDEEEYIAYRPDKYILAGDNPNLEDEDEFAYEKALSNFKWNRFMDEYNSLAAQDISFKRVKRDDEAEQAPAAPAAPDGGGEGGGEGGKTDDGGEIKLFLSPVIGLTAFFALMFILGPFLVRKGPNRGWVTVYIGQMNPLMGPRLENTTVAWLAVKVGNAVKAPVTSGGDAGGGGTE